MSLTHLIKGIANFSLPFNRTGDIAISKLDPQRLPALRKLEKVPRHVAFVYDAGSAGVFSLYHLLSELSTWDLTSLGIICVTLYDEQGIFKRSAETLMKKGTVPGNIELWLSGNNSNSTKHDHPRLIVNVLCGKDGKPEIVNMIKCLSTSCDPITMESLDNKLNGIMNNDTIEITSFPHEPELLIKLGRHPTTEGYPPWHLRWTETIFTGVSCLRYNLFADCLVHYSQCKQNLGA